jgi:CPA2 family monovalent cation:H+ antiporter-2
VILNLIIGFVIGSLIGLLFKERLFFAGIIALSSSGVVAKLLFDMKKTASKESEILMGVMIFEDFFAIILLGILSSIATKDTLEFSGISRSILVAVAFYAVFIIIGAFVINKVIDFLSRIESQELFTALMIGIILLTGSFAVYMGLASAAGAFLLGMLIISYDVEERLHRTVSAFKDIFLIIFFISFGTLLDFRQIPGTLPLILISVPATILAELTITSSAAFFQRIFRQKFCCNRLEHDCKRRIIVIYAIFGLQHRCNIRFTLPVYRVYVFIMTLIAPIAMKNSGHIQKFMSRVTPKLIKYGQSWSQSP